MKKPIRVLASTAVLALVLQTNTTAINVKAYDGQVERFQGENRYETAANLAVSNWNKSYDVVLVSGEGYADALSASVLAKKLNAPIILTTSKDLDDNARKAIEKLQAKNIYIIGGEGVISSKIRNELKDNYELVELKGKDRFETNKNVAKKLVQLGMEPKEVMVVNGKEGFADALSAAPIAAANGQILLMVSKDNGNAAKEFIKEYNSKAIVVGTKNLVPDKVYNNLGATRRVDGGANRFETNLKILKEFNVKVDKHLYIANSTGQGYADALVASALAGKFNAPLVLISDKDSKDTEKALKYIKDNVKGTTKINAVGGKAVIPETIAEDISKYVEKKPEVKPEPKPEVKPEPKPEVKPEPKPEVKPEPKPEPENKAPIATGTLGKSLYNIDKSKSEIIINLKDLNNDGNESDIAFKDPDGDKLTYTAKVEGKNKDKVALTVKDNSITIKTKEQFKDELKITVTADDGKKSVSDFFKLNVDNIEDKKEDIKLINANLVQKEKAKLDLGDLNNIIGDLNLSTKGEDGVEIAWQSTNINVLSNIGKVTRPKATEGDVIITLTATLSKGEAKDTKEFIVTVKAKDFTDEEIVDISLKDLSLEGNLNCIIDNIKLNTRDEKNKTDIEWKSSNNSIVSNTGIVTRTNKDETITLTAMVKKGLATKSKEFRLIVKANETKTEDTLKLISDSLKIDKANSIEKNIKLETSLDGASIVWKSSNEAVMDNTGKVKRPQIGKPDVNVTLTATITKDGKSITKDFNLTVKALTELVANDKEEFYNIIKDALEAFETKVSMKIPNYNDTDYKLDTINKILLENPGIDYGKPSSKGNIWSYGGKERTLEITFNYKKDVAIVKQQKEKAKQEVQRILKTVVKPGMTDFEKELALHDYIVKTADYNTENYNKGIDALEDHTAYGVLVDHIGVCESYAKAMYELLNAAGIECKYVTGYSKHNGVKGGGHAWNMVKLEGQWYNLDTTWDDPVSDKTINKNLNNNMMPILHKYFNVTDDIFNQDHIRGEFEQANPQLYPYCTATKYSFDNMNVDEYAGDGSKFIKIKNKEDLDREILAAINNKNTKLYLKLIGLNMDINALSNEVEIVAKNNKVGGFSWNTQTSSNAYAEYTFDWKTK